MTRKSKREIERLLDALAPADGLEYYGRPEELTPEQKRHLAELFDVDPDAMYGAPSPGQRALRRLQDREREGA